MHKLSKYCSLMLTIIKVPFFIMFLCGLNQAIADDVSKVIAQEMSNILIAGGSVISDNQNNINNPDIGNKGLSGDLVVTKTKEYYKKNYNQDLDTMIATNPKLSEYLKAELEAIKIVMDEAQTLINEKGKGFKGFLPAVFASRVCSKTTETLSGKAEIKLTAPMDVLRNLANRPDAWENKTIEEVFKSIDHKKGEAYQEYTEKNGKKVFRLMIPEYYVQSCLTCHGSPKGEIDITGGQKEGKKLGDLGGAISVIIY